MDPQKFKKMLETALTDSRFREDLKTKGFKALEERGIEHGVPPDMQKEFEKALAPVGTGAALGYKCGLCGVCGTCGLCGGINLGAASAALWATFVLGVTGTTLKNAE
jgi:hypothetical protein